MSEVIWEEPPPLKRGGGKRASAELTAFVDALKAKPGVSAVYKADLPKPFFVTALNKRHPDITWSCRRQADGTYKVYGKANPF